MAAPILKGALIGCGFFSKNHLHAWHQLPGAEIVALCDANVQRLEATAAEFGITRTYTSAQDLFANEALDFVDIATTVGSHRALVGLAAQYRVPSICRGPFADSIADATAMVAFSFPPPTAHGARELPLANPHPANQALPERRRHRNALLGPRQ
ncbi:Gfo/Idh/MocA family protein, partial [Rhodoferax sp.]|uniref:Gfo/Idh/MocA family protein n=1 Tax=Rhodoferax sp. TaxID=50421 RepID=UPI002ACD95E8